MGPGRPKWLVKAASYRSLLETTDASDVSDDVPDSTTDACADAGRRASLWALPLMAVGLSLVACAVLIPASEENRLVEAERRRLVAQVETLQNQVETNDEFLRRLEREAEVARRLSNRMQPPEPDGEVAVLASHRTGSVWQMSPLAMLETEAVEPIAAPPAMTGKLADWCRDGRHRLAVAGTGLFACLLALLAGSVRRPRESGASDA
ncbi:MAG: hypothetical protein AAGI46_15755 [Planctomycetota bacterium]